MSVALILPVYNEKEVLPLLLPAIEAYRTKRPEITQVIFIDDGSTDGSPEIIRKETEGRKGYVLLQLTRNFGHQLAITAGIQAVSTDAAVILDADMQDPLEVIGRMIDTWKEGYDVVYAVRKRREGEKSYKHAAAHVFYRFFRWISDLDMPLDTGDFRLISREVIDTYNRIGEQQPFIRGIISWLGFNQKGIEYIRAPRAAGKSKYTFSKLLKLALSGITSFSEKPLRIATRLGFAFALLSLLGIVVFVVLHVMQGNVLSINRLLMLAGFFFGGIQLLFLGIIGIYLLRVYEQVKGRPRYVVRSNWHSDKPTS